jgi:hypothetical protein
VAWGAQSLVWASVSVAGCDWPDREVALKKDKPETTQSTSVSSVISLIRAVYPVHISQPAIFSPRNVSAE